jgi:hypothetical protein
MRMSPTNPAFGTLLPAAKAVHGSYLGCAKNLQKTQTNKCPAATFLAGGTLVKAAAVIII